MLAYLQESKKIKSYNLRINNFKNGSQVLSNFDIYHIYFLIQEPRNWLFSLKSWNKYII